MEQNLAGSAAPTPVTRTEISAAHSAIDRTRALYERPTVTVDDPQTFATVRAAVDAQFSQGGVEKFLRSLDRAGLRIRDFEQVLAAGHLGADTGSGYMRLSPGDQGQIRERYLALLEQVTLPLRDRFFKLYAYY